MKNVIITILVVVVLGLGGYLVYDKVINKDTNNNDNKSVSVKSTDDLYSEYLLNLKNGITSKYEEYSNNVISGESMDLNTDYNFTIKKNLDLVFTTGNENYTDYKVSDNVLNMFLVEVGNGGYKYLYFIKTDGSLNRMCIECLSENSTVKVEKVNKKYVVNVAQGSFGEFSGARGPIFININGNVETE